MQHAPSHSGERGMPESCSSTSLPSHNDNSQSACHVPTSADQVRGGQHGLESTAVEDNIVLDDPAESLSITSQTSLLHHNLTADSRMYGTIQHTATAESILQGTPSNTKIAYSQDLEAIGETNGNAKFHQLGWKRLTILALVEAIALGSLGLPRAFATLGMVAGVLLSIFIGLIAMHAAYNIGQIKLKFPQVSHYADVGALLFGPVGANLFVAAFVLLLIFVVGAHCLSGAIALKDIAQTDLCTTALSAIAAAILLLLAIPPSFADMAILGYIDFASIIIAIGITMIATGMQDKTSLGGTQGYVPWSAWPQQGIKFEEAIVALNSIVFAYSFGGCLPSFMNDMHTPKDYIKTLWWLGGIQIVIYTLTGSVIYAFVGQTVQSPALLSAGPLISRIVFGIALPVIFISGSINTTIVCRYIHGRVFANSTARHVNSPKGWATWLGLVVVVTALAWIIAEAVPIFSDILSLSSSLFVSGLSYYIPPILWFVFLREGSWYEQRNLKSALLNGMVFSVGIFVLVCGTYSSIAELIREARTGAIGRPFQC